MPRVLLIFDPHHLQVTTPGLLVNGPTDYVSACVQISQALHEDSLPPIEIYVSDATTGEWLKDWTARYGDQLIQTKTYSAYEVLKERWGIEIPVLDDNEVIHSGLLDEPVTLREGQSFENVVLENCYHSFFAYLSFPDRYLADFLNQAEKVDWKKNANRPIVARIFRERLEQWDRKESSKDRQIVLALLKTDWKELRYSLGLFKVIKGYPPSVGEKILEDRYQVIRRARIDVENLSLNNLDLREATIQVEYYLSEVREKIQNTEEFSALLDKMSGQLLEEFDFVEGFFQQHADWITSDLVRRVERRFSPIHNAIASRLLHLRRLVAVPHPTTPNTGWESTQWLDWIVNDYMPYHRWLEAQNKYDDELAKYASIFADWYYQNFIDLKNATPEAFAFSALYNDRNVFFDEKRVTLVILLDNLNYAFFPELRQLFNQNGISTVSERPVFSLIPTATEVGKAAIVAVTGDLTDLKTADYPTLVADTWEGMLKPNGKSARYLATLGDLQELPELKQQVYFLNYLPVDKILHDSTQTYGQDHESRIQDALRVLVSSIWEFARRFDIENRLTVYVISDHGSTKIAKEVVNVLDPKYFREITDIQHHRYTSISDKQLKDIPQMVESQCYIIDRNRYKTFKNYLVARQYYRFAKTDQDFYVHGGLTPEEVVVPFARFEFIPVDVLAPTAHLLKRDFRYSVKSIVELEIGNPNAFPLENISLRLSGLEADDVFIETLKPKTPKRISFQTIFKREPGSGNTRELIVQVQYESQAKSFGPSDMSFTINMKSMMETNDDLNF